MSSTLSDLIKKIESCNYECEAGSLEMNKDWDKLKKIIIAVMNEKDPTLRNYFRAKAVQGQMSALFAKRDRR